MESLNIGPCPADEIAADLKSPHYRTLCKLELSLYKQQLLEEILLKWPEEGCLVRFKTTSNPHDFGTYHEIDVMYDYSVNPVSRDQAYYCEGHANTTWTDERRTILNNLRESLGLEPLLKPKKDPP
jgi:hypothetical protein